MNFTDALSRLVEYSNPNSKDLDAFFCIFNEKMLKEDGVFIIAKGQLCKVYIPRIDTREYILTPSDSIILEDFLKDNTWHYITTWTDLKELYNAIT